MYRQFKQHEKFKAIPVVTLTTPVKKAFPHLHHIEYTIPQKILLKTEGYSSKLSEPEVPIKKTAHYIFEKLPKKRLGEKHQCH